MPYERTRYNYSLLNRRERIERGHGGYIMVARKNYSLLNRRERIESTAYWRRLTTIVNYSLLNRRERIERWIWALARVGLLITPSLIGGRGLKDQVELMGDLVQELLPP